MKPEFKCNVNPKSIRAEIHPVKPAGGTAPGRRASVKRRIATLWCFIAVFFAAAAAAGGLPQARDFRADALRAGRGHVPVMVFFSAESCSYCKEVEELYLKPMYADAARRGKVMIRQVQIDSTGKLRDFSGKTTDAAGFARQYRVSLTPTIKFLDASGRELVPALVGVSSPDFYGSYLDADIDAADAKMRQHEERHSIRHRSSRQSAAATSGAPSAVPMPRDAG